MTSTENQNFSWSAAFRSYLKPEVVRMLFLGFSAGLPVKLIFGTLTLWLAEAGIEKSTITFFSWAALGYSFKFIWAPLVDRMPLPFLTRWLGRRRGWLLLSQCSIIASIICMALIDPGINDGANLTLLALSAVLLGFSSATQDIVIDAYRIETGSVAIQPMMSSMYIAGYRLGLIVTSAGALYLASYLGSSKSEYVYSAWSYTYLIMALFGLVGVITTLLIPEPDNNAQTGHFSNRDYLRFFSLFLISVSTLVAVFFYSTDLAAKLKEEWSQSFGNSVLAIIVVEGLRLLTAAMAAVCTALVLLRVGLAKRTLAKEAYVEPVADFLRRYSFKSVLILLGLIGLYRISDIVMGVVSDLFYYEIGFTKEQIADISKTFGLLMTIAGGFLGGVMAVRIGVMRLLFLGALLSAASNLMFMMLAEAGNIKWMLYLVISVDNLAAGLAGAAFIAFLSGLTSISFTAVQYAIFSSLMTLLPKIIGGYSGTIVEVTGYSNFFLLTALMGVPVLILVWLAGKHLHTNGNLSED